MTTVTRQEMEDYEDAAKEWVLQTLRDYVQNLEGETVDIGSNPPPPPPPPPGH